MPIDTFTVRTGGGGYHIYFKKPPGVKLKAFAPGFGAVEVKSKGKFVIGAGSAHECGDQYKTEIHGPHHVIPAPKALLEFLTDNGRDLNKVGVESDDEATKERFRIFCRHHRPATEGQNGDITTWNVAVQGREFGLSRDAVFAIMLEIYNPKCVPPWSNSDLRDKVNNAYNYAQNPIGTQHPAAELPESVGLPSIHSDGEIKWSRDRSGERKPTLDNAINYFRTSCLLWAPEQENPLFGLVSYNRFSHEIEFNRPAPWHAYGIGGRYWEDSDTIMLKLWVSEHSHFSAPTAIFNEAVVAAALMHPIDPPKTWLDSLQWDGKSRLDRWLTVYLGAPDNKYTNTIGRCTLIAAVARQYNPGSKFDHMLILEGEQGTGKTEAVKILGGFYEEKQRWYADVQIDPGAKDTIQGLQGVWFAEASELEFTSKHDVAAVRRFLTIAEDKVRLPFHRTFSHLPRRSIYIGTFNPEPGAGYLKDKTGNRRFWPVTTNKIDRSALIRDRNQIMAEAVARYKSGEPFHITDGAVIEMAKIEQSKRVDGDPWEDVIENWVAMLDPTTDFSLTTEALAAGALCLSPSRLGEKETKRIRQILIGMGYELVPKYCKTQKKTIRQWVIDPIKKYGL
jgi:predicted P-loop ATPase